MKLRRHFKTYSLTNQLLIAIAMPEATRVAGFRTWLKLGYAVRRGEHAVIRIWMPIPPSRKQLADWQAAGADPAQQPPRPLQARPGLGPLPGRPAAAARRADPAGPADHQARRRHAGLGLPASRRARRPAALHDGHRTPPRGPRRRLLPDLQLISLNEDNSINHQVKTLVHELSHVLLRHTRELDQITLTYSHEELVVESIALTVIGGLGLDTTNYSIPYITSWSENEDSLDMIETCAGLIDRLAKHIEDAIGDAPQPE